MRSSFPSNSPAPRPGSPQVRTSKLELTVSQERVSAESENKTPVVAIGRRRTLLIEDDTDVLFEGVVVPPHGWIDHVRALGAVGVIAGAGITSRPGWERQLPPVGPRERTARFRGQGHPHERLR